MELKRIYDEIPKSTCPQGCCICCGPVLPSKAEISSIKKWLAERNRAYVEFSHDLRQMCPYLRDRRCSIYPVRPLLCRLTGISVDFPCGSCKAEKVLSHIETAWVYQHIYLKGKEKRHTERLKKLARRINGG